MKKKKIVILLLGLIVVSIGVFYIYKMSYKESFNYVVIGDSLAAGRNPYGIYDYGYAHYIRDYLKSINKLGNYTSYAESGYNVEDVINDINYNRSVIVDNKNANIKKTLRESNIVTISIGANDLLQEISFSNIPQALLNEKLVQNKIDDILLKIDNLISLIQKYAKGEIIVIGYYNPLPRMEKYKDNIDRIIDYIDRQYKKLCDQKNVYYVKISDDFATHIDYLPNPLDIHPSKEGYKIISNEVISLMKQEIFN